jgi:AraC family transcriptional regulator
MPRQYTPTQSQAIPVTNGTAKARSITTAGFRVTEAWFPAGAQLRPHTHDRAILALVMQGSLRTSIAGRALDCDAATLWTEPLGEVHANQVGNAGAHVVVVEADGHGDVLTAVRPLLDEVRLLSDLDVMGYGMRLLRELRTDDRMSALSAEAHIVTLFADAARLGSPLTSRAPVWLLTARDMLREEWQSGITVAQVANSVGVHPAHLTRTFRRHFGQSIGDYLRRVRVDWAVGRLGSGEPISIVACRAGFSDQSHFTRQCKRYLGHTPSECRSWLSEGRRVPQARPA